MERCRSLSICLLMISIMYQKRCNIRASMLYFRERLDCDPCFSICNIFRAIFVSSTLQYTVHTSRYLEHMELSDSFEITKAYIKLMTQLPNSKIFSSKAHIQHQPLSSNHAPKSSMQVLRDGEWRSQDLLGSCGHENTVHPLHYSICRSQK